MPIRPKQDWMFSDSDQIQFNNLNKNSRNRLAVRSWNWKSKQSYLIQVINLSSAVQSGNKIINEVH